MTLAPAAGCASEVFRPRFHFTPPFGWMNDPNGLSYFRGEWHLYYQYFPLDTIWGPMHCACAGLDPGTRAVYPCPRH